MGVVMQLLNSFRQLSRREQVVWVVIGIFIILVVVGAVVAFKPSAPKSVDTYDAFSHTVVSSPVGKSPDVYGLPPHTPLYLGFDKLLDHGLSLTQLNSLKVGFYNYSAANNYSLSRISVNVDKINTYRDDSTGDFYMEFPVMFNSKTVYQAKVDEVGLDGIRLYILDSSGKAIYDSQLLVHAQLSS